MIIRYFMADKFEGVFIYYLNEFSFDFAKGN